MNVYGWKKQNWFGNDFSKNSKLKFANCTRYVSSTDVSVDVFLLVYYYLAVQFCVLNSSKPKCDTEFANKWGTVWTVLMTRFNFFKTIFSICPMMVRMKSFLSRTSLKDFFPEKVLALQIFWTVIVENWKWSDFPWKTKLPFLKTNF